jgi:SAM-dependent methyltransferase
MRWQVKAAIQATLSRAPGGYAVHRRLQDRLGTDRLDVAEEYERKRRFLMRMRGHGLDWQDRTFLEVGTGWHPFLPLVLQLLGAQRVLTLDVNPWLSADTLVETARAIDSVADRLAEDFGVDAAMARGAMGELARRVETGEDLRTALLAHSVDYRCPADAGATDLDADSIDYVISSNVLEHVPPTEIRRMLTEAKRVLRPGGVSAHHVDPGDHFSADERITTVNFLKFSPRAWHAIASGLAYHNRLRCIDYPRMHEELGFELVASDVDLDERALAALRSGEVRPHADFAGYTETELAEALVDVFARVPRG